MLSASVTVDKQLVSSIGKGVLVFAAVAPGDTEKDADTLAAKVLKMRLWDDEAGTRVRAILFNYPVANESDLSHSGNIMSKISVGRYSAVRDDFATAGDAQ